MTPLEAIEDNDVHYPRLGQVSPDVALAAELDELDRRLERAAAHCEEIVRNASGSESPHVQRKVLHLRARLEGMRQQLEEARAGGMDGVPDKAPAHLFRGPFQIPIPGPSRPAQIRRLAGAGIAEP